MAGELLWGDTVAQGGPAAFLSRRTMSEKTFFPLSAGLLAMTLLPGCLNIELGGGTTTKAPSPTLGH